jgi:hypothetical protein
MNFKKCISSMVLLILCFLFVGCGTLTVGNETIINSDGSGSFVVRQVSDGVYNDIVNPDSNTDFFGGGYKNSIKRVYNEGEKTIQEIKVSFKSIKELNGIFKDATSSNIKILVDIERGLFTNKYNYQLYLPDILSIDESMKYIKESGQYDLITDEGFSEEQTKNFIGSSIIFESSLTVPGKILESSATTVNKNTVKWSAHLAEINPNVPLKLSYEVPSKLGVYLIAGGIIALALIGIIILVICKKSKGNKM